MDNEKITKLREQLFKMQDNIKSKDTRVILVDIRKEELKSVDFGISICNFLLGNIQDIKLEIDDSEV